MPTQTDVLLEDLGLTRYGARAYAALAERSQSTAVELAERAHIPRQRVYDVLEDLIKRGIASRADGRPTIYQAVDPSQAMTRLLNARRQEVGRQEEVAARLVGRLRPTWIRASEEVSGRETSGQVTLTDAGRWCELARHSVLATALPPYDSSADSGWLEQVERLTRAGGSVRCVYQRAVLDHPEWLTHAQRFTAVGEQARVADGVLTRMILTDDCHVMVPLPTPADARNSDLVLLIEHPDVVVRFTDAFERLWVGATPLPRQR